MALYLGSKKVAGNTTSAPLDDDVKDYKVSFDDTGVIEETFTVNDVMANEIKTGNKLSVILGGIKKVLANILTSITNINSSLNTFNNELQVTKGTITVNSNGSGSIQYVKYGKIIIIEFYNISITSPISGAYTYIANLPYLPRSGTIYQDIVDANGRPSRITLNGNGIGFYNNGTSKNYYGYYAYITS